MKVLVPLAESGKINTDANIRDSQSIIIKAPIKKVWKLVSDIENWPEWNPDVHSVKLDKFEVGGEFKWSVSGTAVNSTIRHIEEPTLFTWTGLKMGLKTIHVCRLEETEPDQTIVSIEESMEGIFTLFVSHQKIHNTLINWLDMLRKRAED